MLRYKILLVLVVPLVIAGGSACSEEASRVSHPFVWPSPQAIKVSESAIKNGNTAELTYEIDFKSAGKANYQVNLRNLAFIKINGFKVTPEIQQKMQSVINAFNSTPTFVINDAGRLIDIEGVDRLVDATGKMLEANRKGSGGPDVTETLKTSPAKALLVQALSQYWTCWVEAWIDFDLSPGGVLEEAFEESLPQGLSDKKFKGIRKWKHLGRIPGQPNLVHLRLETTVRDESLTKAIVESIRKIDQTNHKPPDPELETVLVMLADSSMEVKIDLATLRPVWAKRTKHIHANTNDPKFAKAERNESHEYTFTWE